MFDNTKTKRLKRLELSNTSLHLDKKILAERIAKLHKEYNDLVDEHAVKLAEARPSDAQRQAISFVASLYQRRADQLAVSQGADVAESGRLANIAKDLRKGNTVTFKVNPHRDPEPQEARVTDYWDLGSTVLGSIFKRGGISPSRDLRPLLRKRAR